MAVGLLKDFHDVHHMGGEGAEALLNALLVADIRQNPIEDADRAAGIRRDVEAALGHEGQQPQGFQAHRFAAGIGAGDDQGVKLLPQLDGDGHCPAGIQQGVAGVAEIDAAVSPDLRPAGVHLVAQLPPGEDHVQPHQDVIVGLDVVMASRRLGGQGAEDALDLFFLLGL